ncbi:spermidine/putrescine ABC transporter ATP-binding protein [Clostridia bacterium]|nr:spermidine/putrescine ABC transporter ATP-binding protein [Clostridia bacterium]
MANNSIKDKGHLIQLTDLTKQFDDTLVLNHINMYIRKNEFLTLLGPSGCGKTTTLRILGGFEYPTSGDVIFEGKSILRLPPYKRRVNTVFQKYALFPHMDIEDNIAFGLKIKKMDAAKIKEKVKAILKLVNLSGYERREVSSLSGGQQQRIAIARALVNEPEVLLLDEPLGALDLKLRKEMQVELKNMQRELGITFVYVTHDQEEALSMSDTIAVMNGGVIQQIGTPTDIYNEPKNAFVADFIGESNIIPGIMREDYAVEILGAKFRCMDFGFGADKPIDAVIRPEDIDIVPEEKGAITGVVTSLVFKGVHYEMTIEANDFTWLVHSTDKSNEGDRVGLSLEPDAIHIMNK